MVKEVIWNKEASQRFDKMIEYLESEGAIQAASNLISKIFDRIEVLKKYPEIGKPVSKKSSVRYARIDKHKIMFYRTQGKKLFISNFFDQRQDPNKKPY